MLSSAHLLAKVRFDTDESEPAKICKKKLQNLLILRSGTLSVSVVNWRKSRDSFASSICCGLPTDRCAITSGLFLPGMYDSRNWGLVVFRQPTDRPFFYPKFIKLCFWENQIMLKLYNSENFCKIH